MSAPWSLTTTGRHLYVADTREASGAFSSRLWLCVVELISENKQEAHGLLPDGEPAVHKVLISVPSWLSVKAVALSQSRTSTDQSKTLLHRASGGRLHLSGIWLPEEKLAHTCTFLYSLGNPRGVDRHGGRRREDQGEPSRRCTRPWAPCPGIRKAQGMEIGTGPR